MQAVVRLVLDVQKTTMAHPVELTVRLAWVVDDDRGAGSGTPFALAVSRLPGRVGLEVVVSLLHHAPPVLAYLGNAKHSRRLRHVDDGVEDM